MLMKDELKELGTELKRQANIIKSWGIERLPQPLRRHSRRILQVAGTVVLGLVLLAVIGMYALGWQNSYTAAISRVIPLPAGFAGWTPVSYHSYVERAMGGLVKDRAGNQQVFAELVNEIQLRKLAKTAKISVSSAEVEKEYRLDMNVRGGEKKGLADIKDQYGLSRGSYKKQVEIGLLRLKLDQWLAESADNLAQAKSRADAILQEAQKGSSFDDLVRQYSQDTSANADQPGRVMLGELPSEVAVAIDEVKDGVIVSRPVLSGTAYYVAKRTNNQSAQVIVVHAMNLSEWLAAQQAQVRVLKLLPQTR
jgi:parvulin-like peptidyl-prolyl isomerase